MARISDSTVWRWLHEDTIRPWQYRCWIFPRDPHFQAKAGRVLDLHERRWQGQPLHEDEYVISTDEKTSIQARLRIHPSLPSGPGKTMRVKHEYVRCGAWAYLAAPDEDPPLDQACVIVSTSPLVGQRPKSLAETPLRGRAKHIH